eukprot:353934-Chlamydomonas_euryale.AAC.6
MVVPLVAPTTNASLRAARRCCRAYAPPSSPRRRARRATELVAYAAEDARQRGSRRAQEGSARGWLHGYPGGGRVGWGAYAGGQVGEEGPADKPWPIVYGQGCLLEARSRGGADGESAGWVDDAHAGAPNGWTVGRSICAGGVGWGGEGAQRVARRWAARAECGWGVRRGVVSGRAWWCGRLRDAWQAVQHRVVQMQVASGGSPDSLGSPDSARPDSRRKTGWGCGTWQHSARPDSRRKTG